MPCLAASATAATLTGSLVEDHLAIFARCLDGERISKERGILTSSSEQRTPELMEIPNKQERGWLTAFNVAAIYVVHSPASARCAVGATQDLRRPRPPSAARSAGTSSWHGYGGPRAPRPPSSSPRRWRRHPQRSAKSSTGSAKPPAGSASHSPSTTSRS